VPPTERTTPDGAVTKAFAQSSPNLLHGPPHDGDRENETSDDNAPRYHHGTAGRNPGRLSPTTMVEPKQQEAAEDS
jgi:hypothetical protein